MGLRAALIFSRPLQLGEDHEKTKESSEYLKCLTQQPWPAAHHERDLPHGSRANTPPLKFTAPRMVSVLEQLNVINSILFIPLSQKDLENLKAEVARRHQFQEASRNRNKAEEPVATEPEPAGPSEDAASQPPTAKDPSSPSFQG